MNKEVFLDKASSHDLFDRKLVRQNRKRSAQNFFQHNFLHHEVANRIAENFALLTSFLKKDATLTILEIGARDGYLSDLITQNGEIKANIFQTEIYRDKSINIVADDEFLPFKPNSFDVVLSNLNLHFINQIPKFLLQVKNALKPGGIFIASFFGEENLRELAEILFKTENEIYGRISPRMPPTIDVKTAANLLAKAGFQNPISDLEKIEIVYDDPSQLLRDLKSMGQGNVLTKRSQIFFTKKLLKKILENYFLVHKTNDNKVFATFEILTISGCRSA